MRGSVQFREINVTIIKQAFDVKLYFLNEQIQRETNLRLWLRWVYISNVLDPLISRFIPGFGIYTRLASFQHRFTACTSLLAISRSYFSILPLRFVCLGVYTNFVCLEGHFFLPKSAPCNHDSVSDKSRIQYICAMSDSVYFTRPIDHWTHLTECFRHNLHEGIHRI